MTISTITHPKTVLALQSIDVDNGAVNRFEPLKLEYSIPSDWQGPA
jgi:hypothetical protein